MGNCPKLASSKHQNIWRTHMKTIALITLFLASSLTFAGINQDMLKLAQNGNYQDLDILIADAIDYGEKIDINYQNNKGQTALMLAAAKGHDRVIRTILNYRFELFLDLESKDFKNGYSALIYASYFGCVKCTRLLVNAGADIEYISEGKRISALIIAAARVGRISDNDLYDILNILIDAGANVKARDNNKNTPLHFVVRNEHFNPIAKKLVSKGARINTKNSEGKTPLHRACGNEDASILLLNNGAYADIVDNYGDSPLHCAAQHGTFGVVERMIEEGADVNLNERRRNHNAFTLAALRSNTEVLKYLITVPGIEFKNKTKANTGIYTDALVDAAYENREEVYNLLKGLSFPQDSKDKASKMMELNFSFDYYSRNFVTLTKQALIKETSNHLFNLDNPTSELEEGYVSFEVNFKNYRDPQYGFQCKIDTGLGFSKEALSLRRTLTGNGTPGNPYKVIIRSNNPDRDFNQIELAFDSEGQRNTWITAFETGSKVKLERDALKRELTGSVWTSTIRDLSAGSTNCF
jgi:ankyrin repeat protein